MSIVLLVFGQYKFSWIISIPTTLLTLFYLIFSLCITSPLIQKILIHTSKDCLIHADGPKETYSRNLVKIDVMISGRWRRLENESTLSFKHQILIFLSCIVSLNISSTRPNYYFSVISVIRRTWHWLRETGWKNNKLKIVHKYFYFLQTSYSDRLLN